MGDFLIKRHKSVHRRRTTSMHDMWLNFIGLFSFYIPIESQSETQQCHLWCDLRFEINIKIAFSYEQTSVHYHVLDRVFCLLPLAWTQARENMQSNSYRICVV